MTNLPKLSNHAEQAQFKTAKEEGRDLAHEIIAKEGWDFAHAYFTKQNPFPATTVNWAGWFGFFDVLCETGA